MILSDNIFQFEKNRNKLVEPSSDSNQVSHLITPLGKWDIQVEQAPRDVLDMG